MDQEKAARLGQPSYVWRFGQERRLDLIRECVPLENARLLDVGCGIGAYLAAFDRFSDAVYGVDVDRQRVISAHEQSPHVAVAVAEDLPFASASFDGVLLHEVLEHVDDDRRAVREAHRVLRPGGRLVIFAPNRLYPFETHGVYWRGTYRFGNAPLVNYLPDLLRDRLAPHVRAYTSRGLRRLFDGLGCRVVVHTQIYPGYDKIAAGRPRLARLLRAITYALERTPLRVFGLSHFLVVEKLSQPDVRS